MRLVWPNAKYFLALLIGTGVVLCIYIYQRNFYGNKSDGHLKIFQSSEAGKLQREIDLGNFLIPEDDVLNNLTEASLDNIYWRYVNSIQTICHQVQRMGGFRDGGKEVCIDPGFKPQAPCLVYSFGVGSNVKFDLDVANEFGCEVHCFDLRVEIAVDTSGKNLTFYEVGLGERDYTMTDKKLVFKTLASIRSSLRHQERTLDILKIDIEGSEWPSLVQALRTESLHDVKQILIEVHYGIMTKKSEQLKVLRNLYKAGYRISMRDRNLVSVQTLRHAKKVITVLNELTLIKIA